MSGSLLVQTLEEFRQGGTLDSSGRFALDPVKAREMMERYRLADPSLYVLSLVASAVSGNASFIRVNAGKNHFEFLHDGAPPDRETLEGLLSSILMANRRTLSQFELAIAVNGALALSPRSIVVESCEGGRGVRLLMTPKEQKVEDFSPSEEGRRLVRMSVTRKRPRFQLWRSGPETIDEITVLREFCSFCPIPIATNEGTVLNHILNWTPSLALRALTSEIAPPVIFNAPDSTPLVSVEEKSEAPYSAVIAVGAVDGVDRGLILVVNGVSFMGEFQGFSDFPVRAVVNLCTAGIHKDVSQSGLVRNDGYEVLLASLRVEVYNTLEQLAERWKDFSFETRLEALPLLDLLAKEWSRKSELRQAAALYHELLTFRVQAFGEHHQEVLDTFANLSVIYLLMGEAERAREMMLAVAWDLMTTGRYQKAVIFFEKALELHDERPRGEKLIELLRAYCVCLKELGQHHKLYEAMEQIRAAETQEFGPACRACGAIRTPRLVQIQVEGRSTSAEMCPQCGYGEFQILPESEG